MAGTQITSLICNNFGGIRRKQSSFSDEQITCSDCQNVELFFTNLNSGVGIRTSNGNTSFHDFDGENVVGMFKSVQNSIDLVFVYTESDGSGKLYACNFGTTSFEEIDGVTLTATGDACGVDFSRGQSDYFIFSNGVNLVFLYTDLNHPELGIQVDTPYEYDEDTQTNIGGNLKLHSTYTDKDVSGLGLIVYDSRLWIFDDKYLYYSVKGDCCDFNTTYDEDDTITTGAGCLEFTRPITAIANYLGSIAVFHAESSCLVTQDATTKFAVGDESPGGCASYNSLVFHGTNLFFYDDTKKGVFSFAQIVNGDKTLTDNVAIDIQEELMQIQQRDTHLIRAISVVTEDRNEIWFITPIDNNATKTTILIYDYIRQEWVKRYSNKVNCALVFNSDLYSGGAKVYSEYMGDSFDGENIGSFYKCSIFNYGTDNTLKITKFPPRITIDTGDSCEFIVEYYRNYDIWKSPKRKIIKNKTSGGILIYDNNMNYDSKYIYSVGTNAISKLPTTTFKALEINFKTENEDQHFCIKNIEFSKLKIKQV